ncbi:uncharacterized protein F4807DRAFT_246245 [Annulohypoxylon truncatum]|uniref:uncharacterized protein n=1 Tax=Annulohypoxylon truncatum TaxID=327061 RepID=UPI0020073633|nr:uncharacterized protein F4807DRAFT_246245 [Annulohypoxylon truncatum]KAI1205905.1 hypothetical protein F4807DRAFT_246245 [Annulohypoxylon truncatum]
MVTMNRRREPKPKLPCHHFAQHGRCRFGAGCKFSHDISTSQAGSSQAWSQRRNHQETPAPAGDRLREWKQLLKSNSSNSRFTRSSTSMSSQTCDRFFKLALELMEGDIGVSQETVKLMAQESGLEFIKNLTDRQILEATDKSTKNRLWLNQIQPMFLVLTHTRVIDSNVLEQQVATLYNFIQGIGGKRMKILFDFILDLLDVWSDTPMAKEDAYGISTCELSLSVLATMVDCNTSNIINDNFHQILVRFENRVRAANNSPNDFSKLQSQKHLQYLGRRLGVGEALNEVDVRKKVPVKRAEFVMRKDLPGRLSAEGPRHDNDHDDFCQIRILPTYEEITSIRNEYLPTTDPTLFHRPGIHGRLDREFRLLREDTVGQLRDAVAAQLETMRNPKQKQDRGNKNNIRTYAYDDVLVVDIDFSKFRGMELLIRFRQPTSKKTAQQRRDWWENSKRLQPSALVCIVSEKQDVLFGVVSENTIVTDGKKTEGEEASKKPSLADDEIFAYVYLHLAEACPNDIEQTLQWFQHIGHKNQQRCLVEFPRVLLPSFQHTLMALQRMSEKSNVPFDDLLAPAEQIPELDTKMVEPPQYTTKPGFSFNLSCLTGNDTVLNHSPRAPLDPQTLSNHSSLDLTQSSALLNTLSRRVALIQGPPGTGKSYTGEKIIKVLLANKSQASLGPILCVCYTNHALDQLLVHLKREKVKIIRIGSRSKADELEDVNLRVVAQAAERTKPEKGSLWELRKERDDDALSISKSIQELAACQTPAKIRAYLSEFHPQHYGSLFAIEDDEGFQLQHRPNTGQLLDQWRRSGVRDNSAPRSIGNLLKGDVWTMTNAERLRLYNSWLQRIRDPLIADITNRYQSYEHTKKELDKVSRDLDLRCLHESDVVGVTTTGLARNIELLQKLRCKVMLCEEAGEVLEAHTLTALLPSVEHAILIGDHLQLRPQIANYDLQSTSHRGAQYSLDVSLFERLINPAYDTDPRLPYDTLETQRRMHPNVSELIRSTLYPTLEDGGMVTKYPEIAGMKKRLFWLHHESPEDQAMQLDPTTTSHTNTFEIEMTVALVQHLVRQGSYGADDIAVITPYLGQLHRLRREMGKLLEISVGERDLEELEALEADNLTDENSAAQPQKSLAVKRTLLKSIRLATVDNFQGEEAKVVVISLVRSNNANKCGFLSTSNRINVLLSRAQHGMYLIGNANTYRHVDMWAKVLRILERNGNIGRELELQCPRHPDPEEPLLVSKADDFLRVAPEGGCILRCDRRLTCGHPCINRCHHENLHNAVKCLEPCPRLKKGCQHPCRLVCGDPCKPKCDEFLPNLNITLACGHKIFSAYCWVAQDPSSIACKQMVKKKVPGCDHEVEVFCHTDVSADTYRCGKMCLDPQPCGHSCKSPCYKCKERKEGKIFKTRHKLCKQQCGRKYTTCSHNCRQECHGKAACPLCPAPCEVRCSHSRCSKQCHEPCAPCAEQTCPSSCPHSKCTMPCAAPCDWVPCSKRCEKLLDCGHRCPSVCGETCPNKIFCQTCCSEDRKKMMVDFIMGTEYRDVDLDEDPCIFPDCGHFVTKTSMDGIMDMKAHYKMSAEDSPTAIGNASKPFSMKEVKTCPTCRGSLRNIARYGRIVRRAMLDEATKKFVAWSHIEYAKLANSLLDVQERLSKTEATSGGPRQTPQSSKMKELSTGRMKQIQLISDWIGGKRYDEAAKLWHGLNVFIGQVKREEQPFQKVNNFVQYAIQQRKTEGIFAFDETMIQHGALLQALSLWLKCDIIIVSDFMARLENLRLSHNNTLKLDFSQHIRDCDALAEGARTAKHPRQETEAYIYCAQFCAFNRAFLTDGEDPSSDSDKGKRDSLKEKASERLALARGLVEKYESQTQGLSAELEATEKMIRDNVFYEPVSADEMRAVYEAMTREFRGTGHWYNCENGHPFTVGECGMPMEQARCPECGAAVGGYDHRPVDGVRHADDIENLARGIGEMGIH